MRYSAYTAICSKRSRNNSFWAHATYCDALTFLLIVPNRGSRGSKPGAGTSSGSGRKKDENSRPGSGRKANAGDHIRARRLLLHDLPDTQSPAKMLTLAQEEEYLRILEHPKLANLTEGPAHVIVIDVECLAMLNRLPNVIDALKSEVLNELQTIVSR
jgi:hypothetical protein